MDEEIYQAFVTESEESITQLNNSLLALESNPDDQEAIDDIFRRAHTLKGNFGAMGFADAATVAHAIEDLLDEVRQGRLEVTPERMDLVFEGVDLIRDSLHEIEDGGESATDPSETVAAIRGAVEAGDGAEEGGAEGGGAEGSGDDERGDAASADRSTVGDAESDDGTDPGNESGNDGETDPPGDEGNGADATHDDDRDESDADSAGDGTAVASPDDDGGTSDADGKAAAPGTDGAPAAKAAELVDGDELSPGSALYHVAVELDGGGMRGVDAGIFFEGIPEAVTVTGADPTREEIEAGEYDDGFELFVTGLGAEETAETFADLWAVERAVVTDVSAAGASGDGRDGTDASDDGRNETDAGAGGQDGAGASDDAGGGDRENGRSDIESGGDGGEDAGDAGEAGGGADGGDDARTVSEVKSVRVDVEQLDELHELVEQLVTSRIKLRQAVAAHDGDAIDTLDELDKISSSLQSTVMDMRLIPLKKVFEKFPRLVRDLAREQGKRVDFQVEGQDIELDRTILDEISDPLMHVLRNAVDHGIEPPEEREAAGKPPAGTVELRAEREHDTVVVTVEDDGSGLDVDSIREKAITEGVATREELASLPEEEVFEYIFHPGFSTNEEITDVSGRGVGMDVVKTTVEALDGTVSVSSTPGEGTAIRIRLPVSVAIIKVLFVEVGDREFGVPIKYIDEIDRLDAVESVNGSEVVVHEDLIFPLIRLRSALSVDAPLDDGGMVVRIRPVDRQVALHCDRVTRQEEVVVTPLQGPLSGAEGISGTAVIGDGNVIPILDVGTLELPAAAEQAVRERRAESSEGAAD